MKTLIVIGRRWFRRSAGNTYTSSEVIVDGKPAFKLGPTGGYGDYYHQIAGEELERRGLLPGIEKYHNGGMESLWRYCERNGIAFTCSVTDVARERDL